jgi:hypothetical protein
MVRLLIGTSAGLFEGNGDQPTIDPGLRDREVTALFADGDEVWAVADRRFLVRRDPAGAWADIAESEGFEITCLVRSRQRLFVGTEEAHLLELKDRRLVLLDSFERVEGREKWYTPWGGAPDVRSMAVDLAGRIHVNVHVGGIPLSTDVGETWEPTIDIDADVHQVIAHPSEPDVVLAAGAVGLALSDDGGTSWRVEEAGLHSTYARAVAVAGDAVLLTASEGPRGGRAAVYRATLGPTMKLEKCAEGLPEWFDGNIDSGWLVASGSVATFATSDGRVFRSDDGGKQWREVAAGLPSVRCLSIA